MNCRAPTSVCIGAPARTYTRWPGKPVILCGPCATRLREMGLGLDDERPEWVRRAEGHELPIKDLTEASR
jgi:hypothetical protein